MLADSSCASGAWNRPGSVGLRLANACVNRPGSSSSEPDPEIDIELDLDIAAELSLIPRDRLAGTLPATLLLALVRPRPDRLAWVGDVVLHAVARSEPNTVLPHLTGPQANGALTEGVPNPGSRRL